MYALYIHSGEWGNCSLITWMLHLIIQLIQTFIRNSSPNASFLIAIMSRVKPSIGWMPFSSISKKHALPTDLSSCLPWSWADRRIGFSNLEMWINISGSNQGCRVLKSHPTYGISHLGWRQQRAALLCNSHPPTAKHLLHVDEHQLQVLLLLCLQKDKL